MWYFEIARLQNKCIQLSNRILLGECPSNVRASTFGVNCEFIQSVLELLTNSFKHSHSRTEIREERFSRNWKRNYLSLRAPIYLIIIMRENKILSFVFAEIKNNYKIIVFFLLFTFFFRILLARIFQNKKNNFQLNNLFSIEINSISKLACHRVAWFCQSVLNSRPRSNESTEL